MAASCAQTERGYEWALKAHTCSIRQELLPNLVGLTQHLESCSLCGILAPWLELLASCKAVAFSGMNGEGRSIPSRGCGLNSSQAVRLKAQCLVRSRLKLCSSSPCEPLPRVCGGRLHVQPLELIIVTASIPRSRSEISELVQRTAGEGIAQVWMPGQECGGAA